MIIAHLAFILFVAITMIATVLSPFYIDIFQSNDLEMKHFSAKVFILLLERLSIASAFLLILSICYYVIFTHKLCGPLINIGHTIARVSEKDFTRKIYLRRGDFLKNEAKQINAMMKSLSDSVAIIKQENHLLLADLEESIQSNDEQAGFDAKLRGFQDRANRCRLQLDNFQLIGASTNSAGTGQPRQLPADNLPSANNC